MTKSSHAIETRVATWDEAERLYDKLLYWLYKREAPAKARPYADRLEGLLACLDPRQQAIFGQECRSLAREANEDLAGAIKHRKKEIRLIRALQASSRGKPEEGFAFTAYGNDDLSDRLDLLAELYRANGDPDKAIATLKESRKLCAKNGIPFDGEDLLQELLNGTL